MPVAGFLAALFMTGLGLVYFSRISAAEDYTEMFVEYSHLLLKTGAVLLIYSAVVAWMRFFRRRQTD
jgi:hypothetical protein